MQPLGRKPNKHNHIDCHPPKGYINWWEDEGCDENKKGDRQQVKRDIARESRCLMDMWWT